MTRGQWRKSSFSHVPQGDCVEVSLSTDHAGIRDSKNTNGPALSIQPAAWRVFVAYSAHEVGDNSPG
ncbi:DUF397 domain-containing protein [Alloactinosynnema sp. L-07]|uniref:DUF397 domain-containing protein n=1 Tax=Alloactinosynnema sp. L-07 TaxID=1653480 RepID=UPI0009ECF2B6|nr:DUF397 domain-containing protein [Alloactinosynnema sp. L-07]